MAARFAWVLNLDADLELAALATRGERGARGYGPTRAVVDAQRTFATRVAASLLDEAHDRRVDEATPGGAAEGFVGRAWCPTPRAIALLRRAGAVPEACPRWDVLARVNARAFASSLGETLPGAAFVRSEEAARAQLGSLPPRALATGWRMKRNFGMAGRGQRVVLPASLRAADIGFLRAGLLEGGLQIEPDVEVVAEYAVHGRLAENGEHTPGAVVRQHCDARGAWQMTERMPQAEAPGELVGEAKRVARALAEAGYFGPFGIDAYTYRRRDGVIALQVRSEINARYTMGLART